MLGEAQAKFEGVDDAASKSLHELLGICEGRLAASGSFPPSTKSKKRGALFA
jgi:hypothetical protein